MPAARLAWQVVKRLPVALLASSAAGWMLVIGQSVVAPFSALCLPSATFGGAAIARFEVTLAVIEPSGLARSWFVMLLAMMPPLLAAPLLHVWHRTMRRRRIASKRNWARSMYG